MRRGLILGGSLFLLSMGEAPKTPPEVINLKAKVVDIKGISHEVRGLSCFEGGVLKLKKGSLEYTLDIRKVKKIEVLREREGDLEVRVLMVNGEEETFSVRSSIRCSALSSVGAVDFYLSEVKTITFLKE